MQTRLIIGILMLVSLLDCSKQDLPKPTGFLYMKIEGQENAIQWETVSAEWIDSLGSAELHANSNAFDRCTIALKNISRTGTVNLDSLAQFYYTDGIDFMPYNISGTLTITEISRHGIKGSFSFFMESNFNGYSRDVISGAFGIIKY